MILLPHRRVKNDFRKPRASGDDPYVERGEEFIYL